MFGRRINPPKYAKGIEERANGQNIFQEKQPAFRYFVTAIDATKIFKVNAAGFISNGATLNNAIAARYPDAPPCPTDEYKIAATNIKAARIKMLSSSTYFPRMSLTCTKLDQFLFN